MSDLGTIMFKWLLGLFGIGKIKTAEQLAKPLIKARKKIITAQEQRITAISDGEKAKAAIDAANEFHAQQNSATDAMLTALNTQLKPLDDLKESTHE